MPPPMDVAVVVGSLRKGSYTRKIARALIQLAPNGLVCREIDIGKLEMYNEDLDRTPPASWQRFREQITAARAILILTPEYNRSIPACLKNALDVGSRPQGQNPIIRTRNSFRRVPKMNWKLSRLGHRGKWAFGSGCSVSREQSGERVRT